MNNTVIGGLINRVRVARELAIQSARKNLWQRHKLIANQVGYYIEETEIKLPSGDRYTELRLYKLIDAAVVSVNTQAEGVIKGGISQLHTMHSDKNHPFYINDQLDPWGGKSDDRDDIAEENHQVSEG